MFDYVIVGAGSAGCVLANRLTENGRNSVLVLEAGGSDWHPYIWIPIGYGKTFYDTRLNWAFETEPEPELNNRRIYVPRGKVIGGSSAINAMVYIRGHRGDYDDWEAKGNPGWGYDDVLPWFKKAETSDQGGNEWRGGDGPLHVATLDRDLHPICTNFISAGVESGLTHKHDFNLDDPEGVGVYQNTARDGFRMSAARAYLHPARKRANLQVQKRAHVTRLLMDGNRVTGVEYKQSGKTKTAMAGREVILSAGAIQSPQILQLSGIGPPEILSAHGIDIAHNLPGVGRHLQDHLAIDNYYRSKVPTLNGELGPWWQKLRHGLNYVLRRRGPLTLGVNQGGGFYRTRAELERPNQQLYFSPVSYTKAPEGVKQLLRPDPFPGFLLSTQPTRPTSTGHVSIRSSDPFDAPIIQPNYLSTDQDITDMLEGARFLRTLAAATSLAEIIAEEIHPGPGVQSDEEYVAFIRERAGTVYHPVSTCRMGPDPKRDVVDPRLRVHGLAGLRVVDASVFPTVTTGNTNAPVIMVAEKAADMIINDAR